MKGFVIYVDISDKSTESAKITQSVFKNRLDIHISLFKAVNPNCVWQKFIDSDFNILDIRKFGGGHIDAEIATFFSHYNLWLECIKLNEPIIVFEHDAMLNGNNLDLNILRNFKGDLLNLGEPNWGSIYNDNFTSEWLSKDDGIHKRTICENTHDTYQVWNQSDGLCHCDTMWLFGAHSYLINPSGATKLVEGAKKGILPADTYIRTNLLDIYDYLPHPITQHDEFTLIQRK
jgi:GR25 family glycosyltransferase involved in LPS biosynthesis